MNLKQLSAFREVMLTGTMSAAGRNLNRTQPAISALISSLETEFGMKLFTRDGGRLNPVPEAYYLLEEAEGILGRVEDASAMMKTIRANERGSLRIASMPGPSVFLLPEFISEFVADRSEVSVALLSRSSAAVHQLVATQQFDAGFADAGAYGEAESSLVTSERFAFRCQCALHRDHPSAQQTSICAADLDGVPMAALYDDHSTRKQTEDAFDAAGVAFNLRFETQYFIPLLTYVEHGLACAVLDPLTVESYRGYRGENATVVFRPFAEDVFLDTNLLTPRHHKRSHLSQAFTEGLKLHLNSIRDASAS